ncbi:divergent PAP2 family protein [Irregularibacter muris]|uniref:Divergent PAP2 family protein n=1 Tax=Irregularibacter muris TaxID=1796619 RepID=A0AAE3HCN0_9FIRM|nr:divergent PAP2 family protein [Irregularibacter muris]MCR1898002.1 divergent PAP2 family protein [Irregularibacter muris]
MEFFNGIIRNRALNVAILSWFIAQALKVIITLIQEKKFDFTRFMGSGGMPSSHSSFSMGLTTTIGKMYGWDSPIFAISLSFALIVMYDAAGVRRAAGKQAKILNKMIYDIHASKKLTEERLKELLGHTPKEVFMGALLGIIIANLIY